MSGSKIRRWQLPLLGLNREGVKPDHLHGAISSLLGHVGREWSIGLLDELNGMCYLELTTLSDELADLVVMAGNEMREMVFGSQFCELSAPLLLEEVSWQNLASLADPGRTGSPKRWEVEFLSPTTFRRNGRVTSPWADPFTVWNSGRSRWLSLAPSEIASRWPSRESCSMLVVTRVANLNSTSFWLAASGSDRKVVSGLRGRISYECFERSACGNWDMAWRFLELVGLGTSTAWGLGRIQVDESYG